MEQIRTSELLHKFTKILKESVIEIAILGVLGGGIGGYLSIKKELQREKRIPLAFSERDHLRRLLLKGGTKLSPTMEYSLQTSDLCMKVFEAHNSAMNSGFTTNETQLFANKLDEHMNLNHLHSEEYNLQNLIDNNPKITESIKKSLNEYYFIYSQIEPINENLTKTRKDEHTNQYRREPREEEDYTDSSGTIHYKTVMKEIYDHTDHEYKFNKRQGILTDKKLTKLFELQSVHLNDMILKTTMTNADGEYAAEISRRQKIGDRLNEQEKVDIANSAVDGSIIIQNCNKISEKYKELYVHSQNWKKDLKTAQDESYSTDTEDDDGPPEFQTIKKALSTGKNIEHYIHEIDKAIMYTNQNLPKLKDKIQTLIEISKDNSLKQNPQKLQKEILKITKDIYKLNFKETVEVDRFRLYVVFIYIILGSIIGGIMGAGLNYADSKYNLYDQLQKVIRKKPTNKKL